MPGEQVRGFSNSMVASHADPVQPNHCTYSQVPFPALQPAIFPPPFTELPPPPLELFDLDEEFATPLVSCTCIGHWRFQEQAGTSLIVQLWLGGLSLA